MSENSDGRLHLIPITIGDAKRFLVRTHRHRKGLTGALFAVACGVEEVSGVAIVGRPTARGYQNGWTAEVVRLATDGTRNACSMLYRAAWRAAKSLGYERLVTYTLDTEPGTSLRAAGFIEIGKVRGRSWHCKSRPRVDKSPIQGKLRWEITA